MLNPTDLKKRDVCMKSPEAQDFFRRCGVEIDPSTPLNKDARGKIERPWRNIWQQFEQSTNGLRSRTPAPKRSISFKQKLKQDQ